MARVGYTGLGDRATAIKTFERFDDFVRQLEALQRQCRPFGRDYHAIAVALEGIETTAYHFTRRRSFYGARADSVGPIRTD